MNLTKKIDAAILADPINRSKREKRDEPYNSFGRTETLSEQIAFRVSKEMKRCIITLPNWAEVVRLVLEEDLSCGKFSDRTPAPKKRGRGGTGDGAETQIIIRVGENLKASITTLPHWQAKAREALSEAIDRWTIESHLPKNPPF